MLVLLKKKKKKKKKKRTATSRLTIVQPIMKSRSGPETADSNGLNHGRVVHEVR